MSNIAIRSFVGGELGPHLWFRTDAQKYQAGCKVCRNFMVQKTGGLANRPGTPLVSTYLPRVRLLPFVFSSTQAYVLLFLPGALRVVRDGVDLGVLVTTPYAAADLATLQLTQSGDVVTIVHANYPPHELRRTADTTWSLALAVFGPTISAPTGIALVPPVPPGDTFHAWVVTAISATGSESFASQSVAISSIIIPKERTVTWTAVPGAVAYNIYAAFARLGTAALGNFGFVGTVGGSATSFYDPGLTPDDAHQPPEPRPLFNGVGEYPAAVAMYQQRRVLASPTNHAETVYASRTGDYANYTVSRPVQDDDAVTFTLAGRTFNPVRHILDAGTLVLLTEGAEMAATGDGGGVLRPTDINVVSLSRHGASIVPPLVIDGTVLYIQARQSVLRALALSGSPRQADGFDLTVYAPHLFEGKTITAMAYQEVPHAIVWCVRSDGVLLGCTYFPEQEVLAWHRHDTSGTIEDVCVIPEGGEDVVYLVVVRNGVRCVERMASRFVRDVTDAIFLDSAKSYDGANTTTTTLTLSGGSTWRFDEQLTITASAALFSAAEVGNEYWLPVGDDVIRFAVSVYVSPTVMLGFPHKTVPAALQGVPVRTWSRAVDQATGMDHLEGLAVAVVSEGQVVANPNDPAIAATVTVTNGRITLDRPYARFHVGLPYVSDLQTLDVDSASGPSLKEKALNVTRVDVMVKESTGFYVGQSFPTGTDLLEKLDEAVMREPSDEWGRIAPRTAVIDVGIQSTWGQSGSIVLRHIDPLPLTVLGVIPRGTFPSTR